jgi:hypothetical protein
MKIQVAIERGNRKNLHIIRGINFFLRDKPKIVNKEKKTINLKYIKKRDYKITEKV